MLSFAPAVCTKPPSCLLPSLAPGMEGRQLKEETHPLRVLRHQLETPTPWDFGGESRRFWCRSLFGVKEEGEVQLSCRPCLCAARRSVAAWLSDGVGMAGWVLQCLIRVVFTWQPFLCAEKVSVLCSVSLQETGSTYF